MDQLIHKPFDLQIMLSTLFSRANLNYLQNKLHQNPVLSLQDLK